MNALELVASRVARPLAPRAQQWPGISVDQWIGMLSLDNVPFLRTTLQPEREDIEASFLGLVQGAYRSNGIVFACILARYMLFSEARFAHRQKRNGRPGNLFGTPALGPLEEPSEGRTTADLLATMMLDADLAGIGYNVQEQRGGEILRLRPDWTTAVWGSERKGAVPSDPDSKLLGYSYQPGGPGGRADVKVYLPSQVAWFSPVKDALRRQVGSSWLLAILRDIMGDSAATIHKLAYFRNAATPNLTVTLPPTLTKDKAKDWIELFEQEHTGALNAFRTIYFGGGAVATPVGANLQQLDYRNVQAAGETRIIMASGVHPVLLGSTEGLQGSALNAGNFAAAARWTADRTFHPAWRNAAGSLDHIVPRPNPAAPLDYDIRDVPFLRQDVKDAAEVVAQQMTAIGSGIKDGFEPDDTVDAVTSNDLTRLVGKHTGLVSVQLQPPGTVLPAPGGQAPAPAPAAPAGALFTGSPAAVRARLADGWTFATPGDEVVYTSANARAAGPLAAALAALPPVRARGPFWPVDGPYAGIGEVPAGLELPAAHGLARAFPAMFEPTALGRATGGLVRCANRLPNGQLCNTPVARRLGPGSLVDCRRCKQAVVA